MITMTIAFGSSISADKVEVKIVNKDLNNEIIYTDEYYYGYNASYDRRNASKKAPYISDIFTQLAQNYNVDKIEVISGKNTFTGKPAYNDLELQDLIDTYEIEKILY